MSRVCPLMFTSSVDLEEFVCRPDCCAWAYKGGCAVAALARLLDRLADLAEEALEALPEDAP